LLRRGAIEWLGGHLALSQDQPTTKVLPVVSENSLSLTEEKIIFAFEEMKPP